MGYNKKMKCLFIVLGFFSVLNSAHSLEDKSVRWGYKVIYDSALKPQEIKTLRKILKAKEVMVLYPTEDNWKLPTGFLGVSTHLGENEIKALNPAIIKVESAEKTRVLKLKLRSGLEAPLSKYKIQLLTREQEGGSLKITVKTNLTKDQVKGLSDLAGLIESIEE
ncbi:MAG: hypothetical protein ACKN9V_07970 [Pseudomonadota bacterium]